jgi:hypothetical protein
MQVCELKEIIFVVLADCTPKAGSNGWHYRPRRVGSGRLWVGTDRLGRCGGLHGRYRCVAS